MMTLACYNLGEPGLAYVRERLEGGKTLAHLLLEGIDLRQGTAWAYLPAGLPDSAVLQFDEGIMAQYRAVVGAAGVPVPRGIIPDEVLDHIVLRFLRAFPTGIAVREYELRSASDPAVRRRPEDPLVFLDEEVYGVVHAGTATQRTLNAALGNLDAWWGEPVVMAVLPEPALRPFVRPGTTITRAGLRPLVEHLQLLVFEAYDMEAEVYWSPPHSVVDVSLPPKTTP